MASTSEIYGKNAADSLPEESDRILGSALKSRWTYAAAKGIDEAFAHAYWREFGLQVSIVRLFNTVGPRQTGRYGMVVPNLVGQALRGRAADRLRRRPADPLLLLRRRRRAGHGARSRRHPASRGQAFNLGGSFEVSIMDLARRIIEVIGSDSTISLVPYEQAYGEGYEDMRRRVPDNTKARELVGFDPTTTLDEIITNVAGCQRSARRPATPASPISCWRGESAAPRQLAVEQDDRRGRRQRATGAAGLAGAVLVIAMVGLTVAAASAQSRHRLQPSVQRTATSLQRLPLRLRDPVVVGAVPYWDEEEARQHDRDPRATSSMSPRPGRTRSPRTGRSCLQPDLDAAGEAGPGRPPARTRDQGHSDHRQHHRRPVGPRPSPR